MPPTIAWPKSLSPAPMRRVCRVCGGTLATPIRFVADDPSPRATCATCRRTIQTDHTYAMGGAR